MKGKEQQQLQNRCGEPPSFSRSMSHPTPCLVHNFSCPTMMVCTRELRAPLFGGGGECGRKPKGKRRFFLVETLPLYASHAVAPIHWERQKDSAAAAKKASSCSRGSLTPNWTEKCMFSRSQARTA